MLKRLLLAIPPLLLIAAKASPSLVLVPVPVPVPVPENYRGVWQSECIFDSRQKFSSMDLLEIDANTVAQYSLTFRGGSSCEEPAILTKIKYKGGIAPMRVASEGLVLNLKAYKVELAALNKQGGTELSKTQECKIKKWPLKTAHDCSKAAPFNNLIENYKVQIDARIVDGKLHYKEMSSSSDRTRDEVFAKVLELPFDLKRFR